MRPDHLFYVPSSIVVFAGFRWITWWGNIYLTSTSLIGFQDPSAGEFGPDVDSWAENLSVDDRQVDGSLDG